MTQKRVWYLVVALAVAGLSIVYLFWWSQFNRASLETDKEIWQKRDEMIAQYESRKVALFDQILKYAGKGVCKHDEDCRLIPYGPKVCEDKRGNLIYSALDVNVVHFAPAVDSYNSFMDTYNAKAIKVFNCVGRAKKAKCQYNACVLDR